jgi:hypothetical protein
MAGSWPVVLPPELNSGEELDMEGKAISRKKASTNRRTGTGSMMSVVIAASRPAVRTISVNTVEQTYFESSLM